MDHHTNNNNGNDSMIIDGDIVDNDIDIHEQIALNHSLRFRSRVIYSRRHNPYHAIGLIIFASLYTFLYGGGFFGWVPMQLLLEENGSYSWKCNTIHNNNNTTTTITGILLNGNITNDDIIDGTTGSCPEQKASLLKIQFIGILAVFSAPILGYIVDKYDVVSLIFLVIVMCTIGFTLLLVAVNYTSPTIDLLLYPAFISLGIVAQSTSILSIQAGVILYPFDEVSRLRVISLLNALFDSGSITYLGLWALSNTYHLSLTYIIYIYAIMAAISFVGGLYFWILITRPSSNNTPSHHSINIDLDDDNYNNKLIEKIHTIIAAKTGLESESQKLTSYNSFDAPTNNDNQQTIDNKTSSYVKISDRRPYYKQLISEPFLWLCFFFPMHFVNNAYTLTTMRDFLAYLGDDEYNNRYLSLFMILLPISISGIPMVDYIIGKYGYHA